MNFKDTIIYLLLFMVFPVGCIPGNKADTVASIIHGAEAGKFLDIKRLGAYASDARLYCRQHDMDTEVCLLVDLSLHSGIKRFAVWDFKKDTLMATGLVSHGCSSNPWGKDYSKDKPLFSNINDSHCSSVGKYKIGERGYSQWGIHIKYLMHGLEVTNDNAMQREIVLHGWDVIANEDIYPLGTPEGWGCPAVSNKFMATLDAVLKARKKPVLLWVYY